MEKAMAPHSSTLAWKIPWLEKLGRLQFMGSLSQAWLSDFTFTLHFHALEKEMATHSSVLAWGIPGTGEPGGLPSHRVGHDWSDLAAAADSLRKFAQLFSYNHIYFASFFTSFKFSLKSCIIEAKLDHLFNIANHIHLGLIHDTIQNFPFYA